MRGKLTRLKTNDQQGLFPLRTVSVEGDFNEEPTPGSRFALVGESLTPGGILRFVETSPVQRVAVTGKGFMFETENSTYELEVASGS